MEKDSLRDQDAARASLGKLIEGLGANPGQAPEPERRRPSRRELRASPQAPTGLARLSESRTLMLVMVGVVTLGCLGGWLLI